MSGYLPKDPAGKKPTGNQQSTSAKRYQRSTTRARQRATGRSRSRASASTATSRSGATAATATGSSRSRALGSLSGVHVDLAVLSGSSSAEARQDLLLIHTQALGSASDGTGVLTALILQVHSSLDLITGVLQHGSVPAYRRLGEGGGSGG